MQDVIVGVDRSDTAKKAATTAAKLAAALNTNLHLVMCLHRSAGREVTVGNERVRQDEVAEAEQYLSDLIRTLPHTNTTVTVAVGAPADVICEEAARLQASTIVVGNRRVHGVSRILGSVASDVIRIAPCDVLVANTTG